MSQATLRLERVDARSAVYSRPAIRLRNDVTVSPCAGAQRCSKMPPMMDLFVYDRLVQSIRVARAPIMLTICLATAMVGVAHAIADPLGRPTNPEAVACLLRGNRLYTVREFDEAIEQYKAGALLEDAPVFQYNLAQAYRVSGRYEDAIWHYERFLKRTSATGELRKTINGFVEQMQQELRRAATTQQPDSTAPQYTVLRTSMSNQPDHWYQDRVGWGLTSVGGVLGVLGIYLLASAHGLDERAFAESRDAQRTDLQASASSRRVAGYVAGGAALALLGGGVARLALHTNASSAAIAISGSF